jgi:hypothetical protein
VSNESPFGYHCTDSFNKESCFDLVPGGCQQLLFVFLLGETHRATTTTTYLSVEYNDENRQKYGICPPI